MGMTIDHAKKLLAVIVASISEDDDCFTIEDENLQIFKQALLTVLARVEDGKIEDKDIELHIDRETLLQEYIPRKEYETRLKADMVAMLEDLDLQIDESAAYNREYAKIQRLIRDKINALRGNTE